MKTLVLVRHAKSDWSNIHLSDFDRTLNERGLADAHRIGNRLKNKIETLDLIISSSATRAKQTASLLAHTIDYSLEKIQWEDKLYHAPPHIIEEVIYETNDDMNSVMIVCHNNGITDFINTFGIEITHDMPTCGVCALQIDTKTWSKFRLGKTTLFFYDYPKTIQD